MVSKQLPGPRPGEDTATAHVAKTGSQSHGAVGLPQIQLDEFGLPKRSPTQMGSRQKVRSHGVEPCPKSMMGHGGVASGNVRSAQVGSVRGRLLEAAANR